MDIDFTDDAVLADDWVAEEDRHLQEIRFWFSAENDWLDLDVAFSPRRPTGVAERFAP